MKENQNTLDYNVWSAGEYKNSLENIVSIPSNVIAKTTKEWSVIGENSIHIKSTSDAIANFIIYFNQFDAGTVLTGKAHIRCIKGNASIRLVNQSTSTVIASTNIDDSTLGEVTVSGTNGGAGGVRLLIRIANTDTELYIDNISLTTS